MKEPGYLNHHVEGGHMLTRNTTLDQYRNEKYSVVLGH